MINMFNTMCVVFSLIIKIDMYYEWRTIIKTIL